MAVEGKMRGLEKELGSKVGAFFFSNYYGESRFLHFSALEKNTQKLELECE